MDIEIKKHCKIKEIFSALHSKLEELLFSIVLKLPERSVPGFLLGWLDRYTTKRINELKQQTIKQTWRKMHLDRAVMEIHSASDK